MTIPEYYKPTGPGTDGVPVVEVDIAAMEKRIAELEGKVQRMKAEAQLCRQDVNKDRERALDRVVEIAAE